MLRPVSLVGFWRWVAANRQNLMCSPAAASRPVVVATADQVMDEHVDAPMIAHQTDMDTEEEVAPRAGLASTGEASLRGVHPRSSVPYAVSYPAEGRRRVGHRNRPFLDGRNNGCIGWDGPENPCFSSFEVGRDDASSGLGVGRDLGQVGIFSLVTPRVSRICAADLGMCSAATVVSDTFSRGHPPKVLFRGAVQALTRHHSSASFPPHL